MTALQALIPSLVYLLAVVASNGHRLSNKPIIVGTLTGLLLGDVRTGAIIGAELEIMYMGVISVGGVQATDTAFATAFSVALTICTGMSSDAAIAVGIPAGMIGNFLGTFRNMFYALANPWYDKLLSEDNTRTFSIAYWVIGVVGKAFVAVAMFVGLSAGAEALSNFMESTPSWVTTGLSAAGKMLPAVGMGILLNYLWRGELVIYMIFGFFAMAFLKTSNLFMAVVGLLLAFIDFYRNRDLNKLKTSGNVSASDEEDFF